MVGASIMRSLFNALARLLGDRGQYAWGHADASVWSFEHSCNLSYHVEFNCAPWDDARFADVEPYDYIIGTCGSHVWQENLTNLQHEFEKLNDWMTNLAAKPGASWVWMTTNPFNPDRDTSSWRSKILEALPRFEEMNRGQKEVVGESPLLDWYAMARPILMYTRDQVHFPMAIYEELAKVLAHVLCSLKE